MCIKFILLQNFTSRPLCIPDTMDNTYSSNSESIRFKPWRHQLLFTFFCRFFCKFQFKLFFIGFAEFVRVNAHVRKCDDLAVMFKLKTMLK